MKLHSHISSIADYLGFDLGQISYLLITLNCCIHRMCVKIIYFFQDYESGHLKLFRAREGIIIPVAKMVMHATMVVTMPTSSIRQRCKFPKEVATHSFFLPFPNSMWQQRVYRHKKDKKYCSIQLN